MGIALQPDGPGTRGIVRVTFSDGARRDLLRLGDHIAETSPRRALDFVRRLRSQARKLENMPLAFQCFPGSNMPASADVSTAPT